LTEVYKNAANEPTGVKLSFLKFSGMFTIYTVDYYLK